MRNTKQQSLIYLFLFLVFPFLTTDLLAQDILLRVKKGTVTHNNSKLTLSSPQFQMKTSDKVIVPAEAVLVGTISGSFVQVPAGKSYSFEDIKKLSKSSASKASVGNEIFFGTMQKTSNNYGSSTRSGEPEPDFYSPSDSPDILYVLDKKFKLQIGNKQTKLLTNIKLVHKNSSKIIYDAKPDNKTVELSDLPEGEYTWSYQIEFVRNDSDIQQKLSNVFIIPSESQRAQMLNDYNNVKKELAENLNIKLISKDLYDILLSEYKENKKIFITE
jgi:hypothetical protein